MLCTKNPSIGGAFIGGRSCWLREVRIYLMAHSLQRPHSKWQHGHRRRTRLPSPSWTYPWYAPCLMPCPLQDPVWSPLAISIASAFEIYMAGSKEKSRWQLERVFLGTKKIGQNVFAIQSCEHHVWAPWFHVTHVTSKEKQMLFNAKVQCY